MRRIRCATATHALVESPYVVAGRNADFFITIRNDGNTYLSGCAVEMWYEGAAVSRGQVVFSKESLQESSHNPAKEGSDELENVEPDFALAPGKTSVYRVTIQIPQSWTGGVNEKNERIVYQVKFRACDPTTATASANTLSIQAEAAEEVEYSLSGPHTPMETPPVTVYNYDEMSHRDAPMTLVSTTAASDVGTGASRPNGSGQNGGPSGTTQSGTMYGGSQTLPNTGDNGGLGIGGALAAAAGAAMLAYERRRAANEARKDNE